MHELCESGSAAKYGRCFCVVAVKAPLECLPCCACDSRDKLYAELPVEGDHDGRGFVMRIGCFCDCGTGDDRRTEFLSYDDAISSWNLEQTEDFLCRQEA